MCTQRFERIIRDRNDDLVRMQVDIITANQKGRKKKGSKIVKTKDEVSILLKKLTKEQVLGLLGETDA